MNRNRWSLLVGLLWSIVVFGGLNWVLLTRRAYCFDCGFARGVPFIVYHDAGFPNFPAEVDWTGLMADIAIERLSGCLLAWLIRVACLKAKYTLPVGDLL